MLNPPARRCLRQAISFRYELNRILDPKGLLLFPNFSKFLACPNFSLPPSTLSGQVTPICKKHLIRTEAKGVFSVRTNKKFRQFFIIQQQSAWQHSVTLKFSVLIWKPEIRTNRIVNYSVHDRHLRPDASGRKVFASRAAGQQSISRVVSLQLKSNFLIPTLSSLFKALYLLKAVLHCRTIYS